MVFDLTSCSKRTVVKKMVQQIADKFVEKMNNHFIFQAKLEQLTILPFDIPVSKPYAMFIANRRPIGSYRFQIIIVYQHEKFNPKYVAYAIAHEFAHFLQFSPVDCLCNQETGIALNEAIADYLAYYIISDMDFKDPASAFEKRCQKERPKKVREIMEEMEKHFGKPLCECEKIDELFEGKDIVNYFWYYVVTFQWDKIKAMFEEKTGQTFEAFEASLNELYPDEEEKK